MNRIRWSALVVAGVLAAGVAAWSRWPSSAPSLPCEASQVGVDDAGIARCWAAGALPAAQALTIGKKLKLNVCTADELALVPGVGKSVAAKIIEARGRLDGGFESWDQVDAVTGVGLNRFETLQQTVEL